VRQRLREAHDQQRKRRKNDQRIGTKSKKASQPYFSKILNQLYLWTDNGFFGPGQLTRTHFILQARSISQPSSKSTLPFAGLHYMKQCQYMDNVHIFVS
jgi:hypothetical protein